MANNYVSIVLLTYRQGERKNISEKCLRALIENTNYPYELILVDNTWNNRGLKEGRNYGISQATGKYLCIIDDDIYVYPGWLEVCMKMLMRTDKKKYLVTPVVQRLIKKWEIPKVNGYRCNRRTGSNCMIGLRAIFNDIGEFPDCKRQGDLKFEAAKLGQLYADMIYRKGYLFLIPKYPMAKDLGMNRHSYL